MSLSQSYFELLNFLSKLTPLMYQHQASFAQTNDVNYTRQVQQSLTGVHQQLNMVLEQIVQQQSIPQTQTQQYLNNIFETAQPRYKNYYKSQILELYPGFRFLKPVRPQNPYLHGYSWVNYVVVSVTSKSAQVRPVTMNGEPIGPIETLNLQKRDFGKGYDWIFENSNVYPSVAYLGVANDEGIKVTSPNDPALNYRRTFSVINETALPTINLVASLAVPNEYYNAKYVVISINPLILQYVGKKLQSHRINANIEGIHGRVISVDNPLYNNFIGQLINFGEFGDEEDNPPQ